MSNKGNKIIKAGFGYTIGNYLLKGLSFLTIPIFARMMETSDYGLYNSFVAYETILFIIIGFAFHTSYNNARYKYGTIEDGAKKGKDYSTYVSSTFLLTIISAILWVLFVIIFRAPISKALSLTEPNLILLVIYSFSLAIVSDFNADVSLRYDYKSFLKVSAINAISNIVLSIALMLTVFNGKRYEGRIIGTALPVFIIAVYIIAKYWHKSKPQNNKEFLTWGLKYSLPIVPHGISQVILSQFDRIMILRMVSSAASGIYSFAYNIFSILSVTYTSLDSVWSPWLYSKRGKNDFEAIKKRSSLYIILMLLLSVILMFISPELIIILGSNRYAAAKYCVMPIVAGGFFSFLYTIPCSVEYYHEKTKMIAVGTISAALINIILNYIFILKYGYVAAAYTTLFTYGLYFIFHYLIAMKIEGKNIFDNSVILLSIITILLVMVICLSLLDFMIIRWVLALLIFIVLLFYEEKNLHIIRNVLDKVRR